jgi:Transposase DDE domain
MITTDHPFIELLALVNMVRQDSGPSSLRLYSEQSMFKVYVVSLVKQLWSRRSVWRYLTGTPLVAAACGLARIPSRRTLDRRLGEIGPQAERQIAALGLVLSLEGVTDGSMAASDGSAFEAAGPVWHKKDKKAGRIPDGLHGLDMDADWIYSAYHGWLYGYKAHVTVSVAPTTVRTVLSATVTGSACESHVLQAQLPDLPPTVETLLLDAGYDDAELLTACASRGIDAVAPLSKPIGPSTPQDRRDRATFLASSEGKALYKRRGSTIEPFFATLKDFFHLDPLPIRGEIAVSAFVLLALYAWNLIVLFNFLNHRPLGQVKPVLELL